MKQKVLDLIEFAITNNANYMVVSLEEIKEIKKTLDEIEELKETIKQMQYNKKKEKELDEVVQEDSRFIFNEYCKYKEAIDILKRFDLDLINYQDGTYSAQFFYDTSGLTEEEYDILKSVFDED